MADIIQLLPDSIANQIAAGEVVQRPASVVKELLENAIDAGATQIKLVIRDAGKQLVQVIDNGAGMSATDARMSFERHATSKIRKTEDLFSIRTLGFRGEALASIAAVAQVSIKTRLHSEDTGTHLVIEGSEFIKQEICETPPGTNIQVKNLFYNIPARRKFLKSNTVELRHILDEFQRVAIAHPELYFEVFHNNTETYHLPKASLRKRIVNLFGKNLNDKLVPLDEETAHCKLEGFIGKPDAAKKTRGEQFLLINGRFIKSPYLNHAVQVAFQHLLGDGYHAFYVLNMGMAPDRIDVNVHPTKQEIKFEDEKLIYNVIKAAVRHALSQHNITPSLDFDQDPVLANLPTPIIPQSKDKVIIPSSFSKEIHSRNPGGSDEWGRLYEGLQEKASPDLANQVTTFDGLSEDRKQGKEPYQIHQTYVLTQIKSGFLIIDQQLAHERILYEQYLSNLSGQDRQSQGLMFPKTFSLSTAESAILEGILPTVQELGFDIEFFGQKTFILHGIPAHLSNLTDEVSLFRELIEQFQLNLALDFSEEQRLALSLARSACLRRGTILSQVEMTALIDQLFACEVPFETPTGKKCFITFELDQLKSKFN